MSHQHLLNVTWILFPPTALRSVGCCNREDSVCALLVYIFAVYIRNKLIECYGYAVSRECSSQAWSFSDLKTLPPHVLQYVGHWFMLALLSPMQIFDRLWISPMLTQLDLVGLCVFVFVIYESEWQFVIFWLIEKIVLQNTRILKKKDSQWIKDESASDPSKVIFFKRYSI